MMEEVQLVSTNRPIFHARVTESLMFGLGSLGYDPQVDHVFPHSYYIDNWTNQMHHTSSAILKGRLLWLGGIFSCLLSLETSTLHLKSIVENLRGDTRYLFLPSVEALRNHMITYDKQAMPPGNHFIIKSLSTELAECLLTMSQKMNNPTSCLNTLGIFVKHQEQCAFAYTHEIQHMIITILYTHLSDNLVMREVNFILGNIATKPSLQKSLHHTMVPFLCKVLHGELTGGFQGRKNSLDKALEMLKTIVVHHTPPICEALIIQGFSGAANILLDTEQDYDCTMNEASKILPAAIDFITTMLAKIGSQVNYIRNSKEVPLAEYIPKIIFECIDSLKACIGVMGLVEVIRFGLSTDGDLFKEIKVFLNTKDRPSNEMSGIEYAYLLLIFLVLMEHTLIKEVEEPCLEGLFDPGEGKEDEVLLSMPPLNINVITLAKHILKHENTYYFNVCRNYLYQEELTDLSDMGYIVPQVSME
ncbi:hypothetical protein NQ317_014208 [Molorchus minor]|uniref:Uncharacterized protein n=1 Tax=Molorchus minor TaxID=1323400 RepID=A0ABQ9JEC3_9CUCU|nr:hypothetical protein NQ317_014208 [Molorchus minor]